ncbi:MULTISPECIES: hypothetical protein [Flavobacterium]|uniref:hypothetical protein n=1 Tax=Flavobacterium TaxID=237 RepID=UPI0011842362|nr:MULTISPECIES: hypothetical protein [Flavobacterium]MCR4030440.1 hypothetical protein [Flavobacterium panacis]
MILSHKNCTIEITDEKIDCEYEYVRSKTINWELFLNEKIQFQKTILNPEEISEFKFEIEDVSHRTFYTQEAVIYYLKKKEKKPIEFFRFCVIEKPKLSSQTKSYEFANEILTNISEKYNIPFSFKLYIETKEKEKKLSIALFLIIVIVGIFLLFIANSAD